MKVALLTTMINGGAGRAATRLQHGLESNGEDVRLITRAMLEPNTPQLLVRARETVLRAARFGDRFTRSAKLEIFSDDRAPLGSLPARACAGADIINLHWVAGLVDWRSFLASVPDGVPLVLSLHDENSFTGGCHYDRGCTRYQQRPGCGACPQLGSNTTNDISRDVWQRKLDALSRIATGRLTLVAPSRWLAACAGRSSLLARFPAEVIENGIDLDVFSPSQRDRARARLRVRDTDRIVLCAAVDVANHRKGFHLLQRALRPLARVPGAALWIVGAGNMTLETAMPTRIFGMVTEDATLADLYAAADVVLMPSLQDNLPNVMIESLACGTPVVGFDVGGIGEHVRPGVTGMLAADADGLGEAILYHFEDVDRAALRRSCRAYAEATFDLQRQSNKVSKVFAEALSRWTRERGAHEDAPLVTSS